MDRETRGVDGKPPEGVKIDNFSRLDGELVIIDHQGQRSSVRFSVPLHKLFTSSVVDDNSVVGANTPQANAVLHLWPGDRINQ